MSEYTAREIIQNVALRLGRVADYADGSLHATRICFNEVGRALRDLRVAEGKLDDRLEVIERAEAV